jgi:hypothetical protein
MFMWNQPQFVGIISRPKLHGGGKHVGVLLPDGLVWHMTPDGAEKLDLSGFAHGHRVTRETPVQPDRYLQVQHRADQSVGRVKPYDLLTRNCEHAAHWVIGDEPKSPQVVKALAFAALVGLAAFAG